MAGMIHGIGTMQGVNIFLEPTVAAMGNIVVSLTCAEYQCGAFIEAEILVRW